MGWLVLTLSVFLFATLRWSFKNLSKPCYQIIGSIPTRGDGHEWEAINVTYYGYILASAMCIGTTLLLTLMGTLGIPLYLSGIIVALSMSIVLPAAPSLAYILEHKRHSFTVGGAGFIGTLAIPVITYWLLDTSLVLPVLAAFSICFLLGEGLGRLGCISFGCCYGRPVNATQLGRFLASHGYHLTYLNDTNKACYESNYKAQKLIPIQAVTSSIYCAASIIGFCLFSLEFFASAFIFSTLVHQVWRFISEFYRADYRGGGKYSRYQLMAAGSALYALVLCTIMSSDASVGAVLPAVAALWDPWVIILTQLQWTIVFLLTGRSMTTSATIKTFVRKDG